MGAVVSRAALPPTTKEPTKHDLPPSSIIPQASEQDSASLSAVECRETDREVRSPSPVEMVLGTGADPTLLQIILQYLLPEKALHVASVSHLFAVAATSDDVWLVFCERLWEDKVHVPARFKDRLLMSRLEAYRGSLCDAQRAIITEEELCAFTWSYRMKGHAGGAWISDDPWWRGESEIDWRRFHVGGAVTGRKNGDDVDGRWHFVPETCGLQGPLGSFVRLSRSGRSYPTHRVTRWPPNWGWVLNQCWSFATSFPMPPLGEAAELEDGGVLCQSVHVQDSGDEVWLYQHGMPLPYDEDLLRSGSEWRDLSYQDQVLELERWLQQLQAQELQEQEQHQQSGDEEEEGEEGWTERMEAEEEGGGELDENGYPWGSDGWGEGATSWYSSRVLDGAL